MTDSHPPQVTSAGGEAKKILLVLGVLAVFIMLFLTLIAVGIWFAASQIEHNKQAYHENFVVPMSNSEERWEQIRADLEQPTIDVDDETLSKLQALFERLFAAVQNNRDSVMYRCIDQNGFIEQMNRSGIGKIDVETADQIRRGFSRATPGPPLYGKFEIEAVRKLDSKGKELLVYLYSWDDPITSYDIETVRVWVIQRNGKWLVSDWENGAMGMSAAAEYAAIVHYPFGSQYVGVCNSAVDCIDNFHDDPQNSKDTARGLNPLSSWQELSPQAAHSVGYALERIGLRREAIAIYAGGSWEDKNPELLYRQAECRAALQEYEQSIELLDRYDAIVGTGPGSLSTRASSLSYLKRHEEAFDHYLAAAKKISRPSVIRNLSIHCPSTCAERFGEFLRTQENASQTALELLQSTYSSFQYPRAAELAKIVDESGTEFEKSQARYQLADLREDREAQLAEFETAIKLDLPEEEKQILVDRHFSELLETGKPLEEILEKVPDPENALERLFDGAIDDSNLDYGEVLEQLKKIHLKNPANEKIAEYYASQLAYDDGDPAVAKKVLLELLQRFEKEGSDKTKASIRKSVFDFWVKQKDYEQALQYANMETFQWSNLEYRVPSDELAQIESLQKLYDADIQQNPKRKNDNFAGLLTACSSHLQGKPVDALMRHVKEIDRNLSDEENRRWSNHQNRVREILKELSLSDSKQFQKQFSRIAKINQEARDRIEELITNSLETRIEREDPQQARRFIAAFATLLDKQQTKRLRLRLAVQQKDLRQAYRLADALPTLGDEYDIEELKIELIELLIDNAQLGQAKSLADKWQDECPSSVRLLLAIEDQDYEAIRKRVGEIDWGTFFMEKVADRLADDPRIVEIRKQFPFNDFYRSAEHIHFLFAEKPSLDGIESAIRRELPGATFEPLGNQPGQRASFGGNGLISLTLKEGKLDVYAGGDDSELPEHSWVLTVNYGNCKKDGDTFAFGSPASIREMIDDKAVAFFDDSADALILDPKKWRRSKASKARKFPRSLKSIYAYVEGKENNDEEEKTEQQGHEKAMMLIGMLQDLTTVDQHEALVRFQHGNAIEEIWLPVKHLDDIDHDIDLVVDRKIKLFPFLQVGETLRASLYSVEKFRKRGSEDSEKGNE